jgi:membrane protease YdiL (CAAX protease family)
MLGFGWAFVSLAILAALLITFEARTLDLDRPGAMWVRHLKNAVIAATVVSLLEEILFRGALFGSLRQSQGFIMAAFWSSALYALLHFLEKPVFTGRVEWSSGFTVLAGMLAGFGNWEAMIPAFLNLMLVGVILALVFERTGSLFCSIGLHAGFVFWVKSVGFITNEASRGSTRLWGSDKITDGWMTMVILILTLILIERTIPPRKIIEEC